MEDEKTYVAVGKEMEERRSTLKWVLQNSRVRNIYIIYVHVPSKIVPASNGSEAPVTPISDTEIEDIRERERQEVVKVLDDCIQMCASFQVASVNLYIERETVTMGILELISQLKIRILVMGAAANNQYSRRTVTPSKKAIYLLRNAPDYCQILFICKDQLIYKRKGVKQPSPEDEKSPLTLLDIFNKVDHLSKVGFSRSPICSPEIKSDHSSPRLSFMEGLEYLGLEIFERLYYEEYGLRKALEKNLVQGKEEIENIKELWKVVSPELHKAMDKMSLLETQIENSNLEVKELVEKIISAVDLLQKFKKKRDQYELERDKALQENVELKKLVALGPSSSQFSYSELRRTTNGFDQTLKIGEGGYGSTYKGSLCHTEVAIKILNSSSMLGTREFDQQVAILSKLRHPKIVTLIGVCPESWALIYEYVPGGSLEDHLICKNNSPPLTWQTRIQIATDICAALIFIHSTQPNAIIHGNLKPSNILLDDKFKPKLSDFGISGVISDSETTSERVTRIYTVVRNYTMKYIDPDFLSTGELTVKSDIYSFGIIMLRLLTGVNGLGIAKEVKHALEKDDLYSMLDPSAGDWPYVQAQRFAHLGLSCCEVNPENRPDLESDVWSVLRPMNGPGPGSSIVKSSSEQQPDHFKCPISMDIMDYPYIAADGYTYEEKDIKKWLDSGCGTSPMTGLKLDNLNLLPNRSLKSAIQEWRHHNQNL